MGEHKLIIIDFKNGEFDEVYGYFYKCPNCGKREINAEAKFCPECGIKIVWQGEKLYV